MLTKCFKEDVAWKVMKSTSDHEIMDQEWTQLQEDRGTLRSIFPTGNTKVCSCHVTIAVKSHDTHSVLYVIRTCSLRESAMHSIIQSTSMLICLDKGI